MTTERFYIARRLPPGWSELRWAIVRTSDNEIVCHRDRERDCRAMLELIAELDSDGVLEFCRVDSFAVREGFREEHYRRVKEAREWAA